MKDSLVAINIVVNDKIINKNGVPLLFYWDGKTDTLEEAIYNDKYFKTLLYDTILNVDNYANAKLSYFYFENEDEHYTEYHSIVQTVLTLDSLDDDSRMFYKNYLWNHFVFLYESAYHEKYDKEVTIFNIDDHILEVYDQIQEKYPKRFIKSTVINYVRSELQQNDQLIMRNTDWIISQLELLLTDKE